MAEEILPNLYRIKVPLPKNPLKTLNSYVIKAQEQSLIVDTGMNREECLNVMSAELRELDVDLEKTDFFITHLHADHLGLVSKLATDTSIVYFSQKEAAYMGSGNTNFWEEQYNFALMSGFPEDELRRAISNHPGVRYGPGRRLDFCIVKEGDTITVGDYLFKCVETPGHTNGHMCLYEPNRKILISGDHILIDITPNISLWSDNMNPLDEYLESLDKVYTLDVELVLPGHRRTFKNHRKRIRELKRHHQIRANEVISILEKGSQNAFQVASQMSWDMTYKSWELFPPSQKWFATGEAIAHIQYLEGKGKIRRGIRKQEIVFSLK